MKYKVYGILIFIILLLFSGITASADDAITIASLSTNSGGNYLSSDTSLNMNLSIGLFATGYIDAEPPKL